MSKQEYLVEINKGISYEGLKPWYVAYVGEKFEVKEDSIANYRLTDKNWCQKMLGSQTATIEKRHCRMIKEVIRQFSPAVLSDKTQVEKFIERSSKKIATVKEKPTIESLDTVSDSNTTIGEATHKTNDLKDSTKVLQDAISTKVERPPLGVTPRFLHEEMRMGELKLGINRYLQQHKKISLDWIEEYNELVERSEIRELLKIDVKPRK